VLQYGLSDDVKPDDDGGWTYERTPVDAAIAAATVKHRIERIDDFLLIKIPSSIHGAAAMALRDALTNSIRKLEGVQDPDELFTFESLCDGGSLFGSHHFSDR
jgi:hypothetical protein